MKTLEIVGESRLEFVEKWKLINSWRMISIIQGKLRKLLQNFARLDQKLRKFRKIWRKCWNFLIKISMENWLFFTIFTKYFLEFCLLSESIYPWKITPDFYNFSDFGGRGRSGVPSRRYCCLFTSSLEDWSELSSKLVLLSNLGQRFFCWGPPKV